MRLDKTNSIVLETAKQEVEIPRWIEASVWSEHKLAALDNGVKGGKWFSLIDFEAKVFSAKKLSPRKVYALSTLSVAWQRVRANKGAAGIDQVSIALKQMLTIIYKSCMIRLRIKPTDPMQ